MTKFSCTVCNKEFSLPEEVLERYPNWQPKYCRDHSPNKKDIVQKKGANSRVSRKASSSYGASELNLTLEEVLDRFSEGPQSGLFTDGSARPNPGPGGWGAVLVKDGKIIEHRLGSEGDTTNNRMELTALLQGYQMLSHEDAVTIYTDSELCVNTLTKWAASWESRGWKRKTGPIANLDLIKPLYELYKSRPKSKIEWIKAHNGWLWNEYADSLATAWDRESL